MHALELLLRVIPGVTEGPDGGPRVAHTAMLHPIGADGVPLGLPAGEDAGARFVVRLVQTATGWGATIVASDPPAPIDPDAPPDTAVPSAPWRHRVGTPQTAAAARAVREATPSERRERLIDLVRALAGDE